MNDEEQEDGYVNMKLGLPRREYDGILHAILNRHKLDDEGKDVVIVNNHLLLDIREY